MERSEILEALAVLNDYIEQQKEALDDLDDDVVLSIETLNNAHDYDNASPWWEQV